MRAQTTLHRLRVALVLIVGGIAANALVLGAMHLAEPVPSGPDEQTQLLNICSQPWPATPDGAAARRRACGYTTSITRSGI